MSFPVSLIGPTNAAAAVTGTTLQAKTAAQSKDKAEARAREQRAAVLDTATHLAADKDGPDESLIDQDLPDQGQATYGPPSEHREDRDETGEDKPHIDVKA